MNRFLVKNHLQVMWNVQTSDLSGQYLEGVISTYEHRIDEIGEISALQKFRFPSYLPKNACFSCTWRSSVAFAKIRNGLKSMQRDNANTEGWIRIWMPVKRSLSFSKSSMIILLMIWAKRYSGIIRETEILRMISNLISRTKLNILWRGNHSTITPL